MSVSLFPGRFQPMHKGHKALIDTELAKGNRIVIAIRDTTISAKNPYTVAERYRMLREVWPDDSEVQIVAIPDFDTICYGRRVGYGFKEIHLDEATEAISATAMREAAAATTTTEAQKRFSELQGTIRQMVLGSAVHAPEASQVLAAAIRDELNDVGRHLGLV